jgi:hypothetical protein
MRSRSNASLQLFRILAAGSLVLNAASAAAKSQDEPKVKFEPHRAVYEIALDSASGSSGVASINGRMVYELSGTHCDGYTQNMRFVTRMTGESGSQTLNDLRTSSWEEHGGGRFRFSSSQSQNDAAGDASQGDAVRGAGSKGVSVDLLKPEEKAVTLPPSVYFPIQHAASLIEAARRGDTFFPADLYDGGEKGDKFYTTMAVIGKQTSGDAAISSVSVQSAERLAKLQSWPITMSYFEPGTGKGDQLPVYELTFSFYENGVTSWLRINYGEFAISGTLTELTFSEPGNCATGPH